LFDNDNPRNTVTQESHGFLTRDGIKPKEFREIAHKELGRYPSVVYLKREVTLVIKDTGIWIGNVRKRKIFFYDHNYLYRFKRWILHLYQSLPMSLLFTLKIPENSLLLSLD